MEYLPDRYYRFDFSDEVLDFLSNKIVSYLRLPWMLHLSLRGIRLAWLKSEIRAIFQGLNPPGRNIVKLG